MRLINCDRENCGQTTSLIDETFTLDKGWAAGTDTNTAPFYVCPGHVSRYTLHPLANAVITGPLLAGEPAPEAES